MNEPETWDILERIKALADPNGLEMIQEIHDCYAERTYFKLAEHGYRIYDFFLPALVIDAFIRNDGSIIRCWGEEIIRNKYQTVNLLCSHDGIPVYDALGLLDRKQIDEVAKLISSNGGEIRYLPAKRIFLIISVRLFTVLSVRMMIIFFLQEQFSCLCRVFPKSGI